MASGAGAMRAGHRSYLVAPSLLVELQQLRTFVAVAEDLHMGRAAHRLHLAQPTLSRQIAALERELGVELFSRAHRRFQLTSAGSAFLAEALAILERTENAKHHAQRAHEARSASCGSASSSRRRTTPFRGWLCSSEANAQTCDWMLDR